jgi:hypothetical protein
MKHIGYSLIDGNNAEIAAYGGMPNMLQLPNGDHVHTPFVGEQYGAWTLVERWVSDVSPGPQYVAVGETILFDNINIVITVVYRMRETNNGSP